MKKHIHLTPKPMKNILFFLVFACCFFQKNEVQAQCSPDVEPPTALCKTDVLAALSPNGTVEISGADLDFGSFDNCLGALSFRLEKGAVPAATPPVTVSQIFDASELGVNDVVFWAVDQAGNGSPCITTLEIECSLNPTLACNALTQVYVATGDTEVVFPDDILEGGPYCTYSGFTFQLELDPPSTPMDSLAFDGNDLGTHTVLVGIYDANGNQGNACWGQVEVIDCGANDPPVAICEEFTTVSLGIGPMTFEATLIDDGSYDDCSSTNELIYTIEIGLPPSANPPTATSLQLTVADTGQHDFVLWVGDGDGNWNNCVTQVQVNAFPCFPDTEPPTPYCYNGLEVDLPTGATEVEVWATDFNAGSFDNCWPNNQLEFRLEATSTPSANHPATESLMFAEGTHAVVMWVGDGFDNWDYCQTTLTVNPEDCNNDTEPPVCFAPPSVEISNEFFASLNIDPFDEVAMTANFGAATATDNCGIFDILKTVEVEAAGLCGYRRITRTFVAIDLAGNFGQPVEQVIDFHWDWTVDLPADVEPGEPLDTLTNDDITTDGISLIALSFEDQFFDFNCDNDPDKIVRTYTLINWCQAGNDPEVLDLPRLDLDGDGNDGDAYSAWTTDSVYQVENGAVTGTLGEPLAGVKYTQEIRLNYLDTLEFTLTGTVFQDMSVDCAFANEPVLAGWPVKVMGTVSGQTYHATTDASGEYEVSLCVSDTIVEVSLDVPFNYGQTCPTTHTVNLTPGISQTVVQDVPVQLDSDCPLLSVDISAPFLRRCFDNDYYVNYCNLSDQTIDDIEIEVTLDEYMDVTATSLTGTQLDSVTWTFDIGTLAPGECSGFQIDFLLDCQAPIGLTHCVEAHITPDTICPMIANFTGANIEVSGYCEDDSIHLEITNTGTAAMAGPLEYIVVEDVIMFDDGDFDLGPGETMELDVIMASGATYRLEADQEPNHPFGGVAAIAIEGCGGLFTPGFVNFFPMNDPNPFIATDCQENVSSFDPNDKLAFPIGYGDEHLIERGMDIEYLIRFQNTGTDTAFNVAILDTLSQFSDPVSIRPGAASHDYQFELLDGNVLRFTFANIMLPDSNVNEMLSHGFVKFRASQMPNLNVGTVIENSADIYFDFNDPVETNTVFHTIGEDFIQVVSNANERPAGFGDLNVYPNPSFGDVTFELPVDAPAEAIFQLHDQLGRLVVSAEFAVGKYRFERGTLVPGVYFYSVDVQGVGKYSGKIILR